MQIKGGHTFQAPRPAVWEALMDPTVLAQALPGGEQLEKIGEDEYRAVMNVRVGPVQGRFEGKVELEDLEPPAQYRMKVSGAGPAGHVHGSGAIVLTDDGKGTLMSYEGDVQVGGKIASVGQRLIDSTAKSVIRQGLKVLDEQIQARIAPSAATPTPEPVVAPTPSPTPLPLPTPTPQPAASAVPAFPQTGAFAAAVIKDVVRDLASDYIPPQHQEKALYALLGALGMLLFVILVRLVQRD